MTERMSCTPEQDGDEQGRPVRLRGGPDSPSATRRAWYRRSMLSPHDRGRARSLEADLTAISMPSAGSGLGNRPAGPARPPGFWPGPHHQGLSSNTMFDDLSEQLSPWRPKYRPIRRRVDPPRLRRSSRIPGSVRNRGRVNIFARGEQDRLPRRSGVAAARKRTGRQRGAARSARETPCCLSPRVRIRPVGCMSTAEDHTLSSAEDIPRQWTHTRREARHDHPRYVTLSGPPERSAPWASAP